MMSLHHGYGSPLYWFLFFNIDPNLKYQQMRFHQLNNDLGISEGAD